MPWRRVLLLCLPLLAVALDTPAAIVSDVTNTRHNLSTTGPGTTKATGESQICVFCHTPHGATENLAPLWNREASTATYQGYDSSSIDAADLGNTVTNSSKLCLSCHDGTIAIGNVNVANGQENVSIAMTGTDPDGTMPAGSAGAQSGFTRDLGTDLRNDHPISFTYDSALALADGELRDPATSAHIGNRASGVRPVVPLENNQLECASCHDPHVRDDSGANIKFLRLNRLQQQTPAGGNFDQDNDIICLACHDKMGTAWSESAHAKSTAADELYKSAAATQREFPANTQVWQAACLNCHDTHTVQGARRLAREGTDSTATPKSGGNSAIEETCYQCHTNSTDSVLNNAPDVPDIKTDFTTLARRMPITTAAQDASSEVHDIRDADFTEPQSQLGLGNLNNRHVECTDCHNPHRVLKNALFNGSGSSTAATHNHAAGHTNIASGTLTGTWGVEPNWSGSPPTPTFYQLPNSYTVKQGAPAIGASTAVTNSYVTREYQVCLKCHSDYGYSDANLTTSNWDSGRPDMNGPGLTGANPTDQANFNVYSNQAREFAPYNSAGSTGATFTSNNHRSWHPVIAATGRTHSSSTRRNTNWESPWDGSTDIGTQTMYCTDCHGAATSGNGDSGEGDEGGNNFGPHGSSNRFILKGDWSNSTNAICFKCHDSGFYNSTGGTSGSAFQGDSGSATHGYHRERIGSLQCNWCHVAVPHGWKNRSFLVNLRDVGPEAGVNPGTEIGNSSLPYTRGPYYMRAYLKINSFPSPGSWSENNCLGKNWMTDNCVN
jgi:hypothetical protein